MNKFVAIHIYENGVSAFPFASALTLRKIMKKYGDPDPDSDDGAYTPEFLKSIGMTSEFEPELGETFEILELGDFIPVIS